MNRFLHFLLVDIKPQIDKTKEPDLNNFVPEYDLKLFRDAQALASEKIEEELKSLPSTKGKLVLIQFRFFYTFTVQVQNVLKWVNMRWKFGIKVRIRRITLGYPSCTFASIVCVT